MFPGSPAIQLKAIDYSAEPVPYVPDYLYQEYNLRWHCIQCIHIMRRDFIPVDRMEISFIEWFTAV